MSGLFGILESGKKALAAAQLASNTIGNNVANVNTPGYSREEILLTPSHPLSSVWGPLGTGVAIAALRRYRDEFLDAQWRFNNGDLGRWKSLESHLNPVEALVNEPSDSGLRHALDEFWQAWQELANEPESLAARRTVRERGVQLTEAFHRLARGLREQRDSLNEAIREKVKEINGLLEKIAALNAKIASLQAASGNAGTVQDEQDLLLDQLSQLISVKARRNADGTVTVHLGSFMAVQKGNVSALVIGNPSDGKTSGISLQGVGGAGVPIDGGELKGLFEMRDDRLGDTLTKLDRLAQAIAEQVNAYHRTGYGLNGTTGTNFFRAGSVTAETLALDDRLSQEVDLIAASSDGTPGNNSLALSIAAIKDLAIIEDNWTADHYYANLVSTVGAWVEQARTNHANAERMAERLEFQKQSVQGVSLDEEMANLIKYQHAYEAAARVITAVDEMLQTVLKMI